MSDYGHKRTTNTLMMPLDASGLLLDLRLLSPAEAGVYLNLLLTAWRWGNPVRYSHKDLAHVIWVSPYRLRKILASLKQWKFIATNGEDILLLKMEEHTTAPLRRPLDDYLRAHIFERDGTKCRYCGATEGVLFVIDHIIPWTRGGDDTTDNLCVACSRCNASKGDKLLEEWRGPKNARLQ